MALRIGTGYVDVGVRIYVYVTTYISIFICMYVCMYTYTYILITFMSQASTRRA